MSNLENERDERDDDSHEDRGISKSFILCFLYIKTLTLSFCKPNPFLKKSIKCLLVIFMQTRLIWIFRPMCDASHTFFSTLLCTVSNTRFIAAVIERHTHSPERRRRYWGRSGTESDHGKWLGQNNIQERLIYYEIQIYDQRLFYVFVQQCWWNHIFDWSDGLIIFSNALKVVQITDWY